MPPADKPAKKRPEDIEGVPCAPCVKCGTLLVVPFRALPIPEGVECADGCDANKERR